MFNIRHICTLSIFSGKTCKSVKKNLWIPDWVLWDKSDPEGSMQEYLPCHAAHDSTVGSEAARANWPANQLHNI